MGTAVFFLFLYFLLFSDILLLLSCKTLHYELRCVSLYFEQCVEKLGITSGFENRSFATQMVAYGSDATNIYIELYRKTAHAYNL